MSSITAAQSSILKLVKQWLNLPHNCIPGTVFHPGVLDLPYLPHFHNSAKPLYILVIERSVDPMIVKLRQSILTSVAQGVSNVVFDVLSAAKSFVANIHSGIILVTIYAPLTLVSGIPNLSVQNKFLDIVVLEQDCPIWRKLMFGLPEKQLSFLLRAGCDMIRS